MEIKWFTEKEKEGVASLYQTNLDLNIVATKPIEYAYMVQIGIDELGNLIVKPLTKSKVETGDLDEYSIYKIAIKKSYSRVSSTSLMKQIGSALGIDLDKKTAKRYKTVWNDDENVLIIKTGKEK
ncbi:MAG: hypothetical protein MJ239_03945 [Bacilli bacterium]|nr:hypothetical protein [Bacilli bacterium]